jgi:hypothetical protein
MSKLDSLMSGEAPLLLDLTLWHAWHIRQGTLPDEWKSTMLRDASGAASLRDISRELGSPCWRPIRPWLAETPGIEVVREDADGQRETTWRTPHGELTSRWSLGPDGDWWQMAYPCTRADQLDAALDLVRAREYHLDDAALRHAFASAEPDEIIVLELPRQPYSDLLHDLLGWSEGLMLLYERPDVVGEMLAALGAKLDSLVTSLGDLPVEIAVSPDNLDGQFISPPAFAQHMAEGYARSAAALHAAEMTLWVHVGGPASRLLPGLAQSGVDGIEGICAAPQGDTSLPQARELAGRGVVLWGGIAQDALLPSTDEAAFRAAVAEAVEQASGMDGALLGVADKVPVDADVERLRSLAELIATT